tara:strand:+ start:5851 stop:6120 length:270 start_codon:yes stop_codon:yes gene_type:complete
VCGARVKPFLQRDLRDFLFVEEEKQRGELVLVCELGFRIFFEREKKREREKERGFVKVALLTADHAKMYLKLRHRSTYYNYGLLLLLLL